jgi:hypothetical protein
MNPYPVNPGIDKDGKIDLDAWAAMSDDPAAEHWFAVNPHFRIGVASKAFAHRASPGGGGETNVKHLVNESLEPGDVLPAKGFGPGADIQRHLDTGAVSPATSFHVHMIREGKAAQQRAAQDEADRIKKERAERGEDDPKAKEEADQKRADDARKLDASTKADAEKAKGGNGLTGPPK